MVEAYCDFIGGWPRRMQRPRERLWIRRELLRAEFARVNGNSGKDCVLRHVFDSKEFCETLRSESHSLRQSFLYEFIDLAGLRRHLFLPMRDRAVLFQ